MMRSLFSGVSGLKVHQTKMDVIGNNIANVNTVAYKSMSVTFSEVFYQTTQSASGANATTQRGGTNAKQIGLGSNVGAISTSITSEGASQRTDNAFDLKIGGEAFFIVQSNGEQLFTRAGNFTLDEAGNLVTSSGAYVMGWQVDDDGVVQKDSVTPLKPRSAEFAYTAPEATAAYTVSGNINKQDTNFLNGNPIPMTVRFYDSLGYEYTANLSVTQDADDANKYTVDLSSVYCNNKLTNLSVSQSPIATIVFNPVTGAPTVTGSTVDADGNFIFSFAEGGFTTASQADMGLTDEQWEQVTQIDTGSSLITQLANGIAVDYSQLTLLADETKLDGSFGSIDGLGTGKAVGTLSGISISNDGCIIGSYTNGDVATLGQIAVATFSNANGLEKEGDNYYKATLNSGLFDGVGYDITSTGGSISSGVLEMSNVDLSTEFTEMITTQRGFQANSRIITVSDTLIEELVNLKR